MQITSNGGSMVVDFYPVKDWDNTPINNRILKVLSFKGNTQHKMLITRDEFYYQVKQYVDKHKYQICLLYTSPSPRDVEESRMPSSA